MQSARARAGRASPPPQGRLIPLGARLDPSSPAPLAVGLSGGGDSLALLTVALDWAKPHGRRVLALTVDHGLNPESARWTARAGEQAQALGADWRALIWTGPKPTTGLPAKARRARHALLADAAREAGASVLLLGHTLDDALEADAMRADGTPLGRLADWAPSPVWPEGRDIFVYRPLLQTRRAELRDRLRGLGLDWLEDPANADPRFARTRARAQLHENPSPSMGEGQGWGCVPPVDERAPSLSHLLSSTFGAAPPTLPFPHRGGRVSECFGVLAFPRAVFAQPGGRALLAMAALCAGGGERPPRGDVIDGLARRLAAEPAFTATLVGARLDADADEVRLYREAGETARGGLSPLRLVPERAAVWDGRFEITAMEPGEIRAARGLLARLSGEDRKRLNDLPPAARGSVPVLIRDADPSPVLAERVARMRNLAQPRLKASCGLIAHEREITGLRVAEAF